MSFCKKRYHVGAESISCCLVGKENMKKVKRLNSGRLCDFTPNSESSMNRGDETKFLMRYV